MSNHSNDHNDDDAELFRLAVGSVSPLKKEVPVTIAKPKPKPSAKMAKQDEELAFSEFQKLLHSTGTLESGDILSYHQEECPVIILKKLKRGEYTVQDELDLHGNTAQQATLLLREFLNISYHNEMGCVRIIHGKGHQKDTRFPVLKNLVDYLLRQRADVFAFHSAPQKQGGTGAVLVLLKKRKKR